MNWLILKYRSIFLSLLILGAVIRVIFLFLTKNLGATVWPTLCFSWVAWTVYALFYNKDMYSPFNWNNGENQIGRVAITMVALWVYVLLMYKDFW